MEPTAPTVPGTLYILSAPSGAGKTSLLAALLEKRDSLTLSVSHTTRSPRPGEQDGVHYHFVSPERFQEMIDAGQWLEYAQVFDHFYGTSREAVLELLESGKDVILEIDWQGAQQVRSALPGCCSIFILPPSLEALEQRLRNRKQDTEAVILRRLAEARADCGHYNEYTYLIVNDQFTRALADLESIFHANNLQVPRQECRESSRLSRLLAEPGDSS